MDYITKDKKLKTSDITDTITALNYNEYVQVALFNKDCIYYFKRTPKTELIFSKLSAPLSANIILLYKENYMYTDNLQNANIDILLDKEIRCKLCRSESSIFVCSTKKCLICIKCLDTNTKINIHAKLSLANKKIQCPYCSNLF